MKEEKNEVEIRRKIIHVVFGVLLAGLLFYNMLDKYVLGISTLILIILLSLVRTKYLPAMEWILENFERKEDRKDFPLKGTVFYLIGAELAIIFFPKEVAIASILILAIGDAIPRIITMYYKKIRHPFSRKRYLEGSLVGFLLAFLVAMNFVIWYEAFLASTVSLFLEAIDPKIGKYKIDDNIIIPVTAGLTIVIVRMIIPLF